MQILIGFLIALAVGLTGIGGGSFTVPALILAVGLPATAAVGTAFVFAGAVRLIASPWYLAGKHVSSRYLWALLEGAVPGLLLGTFLLRWLSGRAHTSVVVLVLGLLLAGSSAISFIPRLQNRNFAAKNAKWLPWLAIPIGAEAGFSSAGAGALGTVLLLNYSEMTPQEVVGTDLLFGLALAIIGSAFHWGWGSINWSAARALLIGGVPGVLLGCLLSSRVPARKLKTAIALVAIVAGLQLVWDGVHSILAGR